MKNPLLISLLIFALLLSACSGNAKLSPEKAGKALAEVTCSTLAANDDATPKDVSLTIDQIAQKYGFTNYTSITSLMSQVTGTTEFNEISVSLRTNLQEMCGDELESFGLSAAEMAQSIMQQ